MRYLFLAAMLSLPLWAWGEPESVDRVSSDPVIEHRLMVLSEELRCLVCQNETLAASRAGLAIDLRNEIRDLMTKGYTDKQVVDYLVARYGDFVRFRPPLKPMTFALWWGPFVLAALAIGMLVYYLGRVRVRTAKTGALSKQDHDRVNTLLSKVREDGNT
ncbi:MAG: cytochrome c-type biogenesis protein CcmH [Gammaproteobacteria bacterium]|nr:cytochrome c-type biogenesis protein CcmH [Gammaproteobacteria bacterium]